MEEVNSLLSVACRCLPIYPAVSVPAEAQVVIKDVQESRHLAKDQHLEALLEQLGQEEIEDLELHAVVDQMLPVDERWTGLNILEEVRMVADLPQLHDGVSQLLGLPARHRRVHHEAVVLLDAFVDGLLMGTQLNFDDELDLLRQVLGHIFLYSAEEEGP